MSAGPLHAHVGAQRPTAAGLEVEEVETVEATALGRDYPDPLAAAAGAIDAEGLNVGAEDAARVPALRDSLALFFVLLGAALAATTLLVVAVRLWP